MFEEGLRVHEDHEVLEVDLAVLHQLEQFFQALDVFFGRTDADRDHLLHDVFFGHLVGVVFTAHEGVEYFGQSEQSVNVFECNVPFHFKVDNVVENSSLSELMFDWQCQTFAF